MEQQTMTYTHLEQHTTLPILDIVLKSNLVRRLKITIRVVLRPVHRERSGREISGRGI